MKTNRKIDRTEYSRSHANTVPKVCQRTRYLDDIMLVHGVDIIIEIEKVDVGSHGLRNARFEE